MYILVATGVWFAVDPIARVFLLPGLFVRATRIGLVLLLPVALAAAWKYPQVGSAHPPERPAHPHD